MVDGQVLHFEGRRSAIVSLIMKTNKQIRSTLGNVNVPTGQASLAVASRQPLMSAT
jgi:hypothetical protein